MVSTIANASGTGRTGSGVTLAVEGIDVSHAVEVKNSQMREFYLEAKAELGYTSSQLRQSPELKAKVDALKYKSLENGWMLKGLLYISWEIPMPFRIMLQIMAP